LFATYRYNVQGQLSEKTFYRKDGVALPKSIYIYDDSGKLVKLQDYSALTNKPYLETVYNYENGLLKNSIGSNIEQKDGFLSRKDFSYDSAKRYFEVLETVSYRSFPSKTGIIQDDRCRFSQVIFHDKDGKIAGRNVLTFDEYDNPVLVEALSLDGTSMEKIKYAYEYDRHKNWTKASKFNWRNNDKKWILGEITYRKITYRNEK